MFLQNTAKGTSVKLEAAKGVYLRNERKLLEDSM